MFMLSRELTLAEVNQTRETRFIPRYQRKEVWDNSRKRDLIDSILSGWPLNKFYLAQGEDESDGLELAVIDGQQRLAALRDFMDGTLSLSEKTVKKFDLQGDKFSDLPPKLRDRLQDFIVQCDVLVGFTEEDREDFFQRLQMGKPLTAREKLKATISGLTDYGLDLTEHQFFKTSVDFKNTQDAYFDITSKILAIAVRGVGTNTRLNGIQELFESRRNFAPTSSVAMHVRQTFDFLSDAFPERSLALHNRLFTQSVITLASQLVASGHAAGHEAEFRDFVQKFHADLVRYGNSEPQEATSDYVEFSLASKSNLYQDTKTRHNILVRKMWESHESLAKVLAADDGHVSWVHDDEKVPATMDVTEVAPIPSRLSVTTEPYSVSEVLDRYDIPRFQRGEVWDIERKRKLIDTMLRGWKFPKLLLSQAEDGSGRFDVIDGQQRLSAIRDFLRGEIDLLPETVDFLDLTSAKFQDLPEDIVKSVRNFTLECDVMVGATIEEKAEIYQRVQRGMPLTGKEQLNAVHSALRDFCIDLTRADPRSTEDNRHPFFQTSLVLQDGRYNYLDIPSKLLMVAAHGFNVNLKKEAVKKFFEAHIDFSVDSQEARHALETFDFLASAFAEPNQALKEPSFILSTVLLASKLVVTGKSAGQEETFRKFIEEFHAKIPRGREETLAASDPIYREFSGATKGDLRTAGDAGRKHEILLAEMRNRYPSLADIFQEGALSTDLLATSEAGEGQAIAAFGVLSKLSRGEQDILELAVKGFRPSKIAAALNRSSNSVSTRLVNIRYKLGVQDNESAFALWKEARAQYQLATDTDTMDVAARAAFPQLSERERTILAFLARGLSHQEIAERLGVAVGSAKVFATHMYRKLGVHKSDDAVALWLKAGSTATPVANAKETIEQPDLETISEIAEILEHVGYQDIPALGEACQNEIVYLDLAPNDYEQLHRLIARFNPDINRNNIGRSDKKGVQFSPSDEFLENTRFIADHVDAVVTEAELGITDIVNSLEPADAPAEEAPVSWEVLRAEEIEGARLLKPFGTSALIIDFPNMGVAMHLAEMGSTEIELAEFLKSKVGFTQTAAGMASLNYLDESEEGSYPFETQVGRYVARYLEEAKIDLAWASRQADTQIAHPLEDLSPTTILDITAAAASLVIPKAPNTLANTSPDAPLDAQGDTVLPELPRANSVKTTAGAAASDLTRPVLKQGENGFAGHYPGGKAPGITRQNEDIAITAELDAVGISLAELFRLRSLKPDGNISITVDDPVKARKVLERLQVLAKARGINAGLKVGLITPSVKLASVDGNAPPSADQANLDAAPNRLQELSGFGVIASAARDAILRPAVTPANQARNFASLSLANLSKAEDHALERFMQKLSATNTVRAAIEHRAIGEVIDINGVSGISLGPVLRPINGEPERVATTRAALLVSMGVLVAGQAPGSYTASRAFMARFTEIHDHYTKRNFDASYGGPEPETRAPA